ncbi:hypothetical protein MACJ_000987 [Theileria orientalis]|uniref:Uncharacterized protein n=1 Tax=Theileria orientalis TaxID=68886 RepID=A0A976QTD2_THEOR|nr:hypothetical protein MACJ_000987 [Theileria orientalis]
MKGAYTFVRFFWIGILIQNSSCFELNIGKTVSYSSGSTQVTVEQKSESQNLYTHKLPEPLQLKEICNGDKKIYLDLLLVKDQLLLSASVIWSFKIPSVIQLNLEKSSVLLLNEEDSTLDVQAIFSEKLVTNLSPRTHSTTELTVDVDLSKFEDYDNNNTKVYVTDLEFSEDRFKRYTLRNYNLESTKLGRILYNDTELKTKTENDSKGATESNLVIPYKDNIYSILVYAYNNFPLLIEVLYTFNKRQFYGYTAEKKWHHVIFPAFHDPSFRDFLYNKLNYYACKNGFKYTIDIKQKTEETDQAYSMNNYCVESDRVETIQNSLKASFYQDEKFKSAGYGCVEHTASSGKKFFVDHLMSNTSVLQFPKTPSFTKAIRVYNRMNKRHYLIGFVDELDKLIYYKYENGEWTEETTLSKDKNERLSEEIKLLIDKLYANDVTTFTINDVSDPNKKTPEDFDRTTVDASDILHKITTFIVEKKTGYSSSVTVTPTSNHPATGFSKYTHQPTPKPCQRSLVLYKGKKLLWWYHNTSKLFVINEVQEKKLDNIDVYFSDTIDFPLLTGVFQSNKTIEYYFIKKYNKGVFWQILDETAFRQIIGDNINKNNVHAKLTENGNRRLIQLLKKIALSVVDTVLVLVDKREAYDRTAASNAYKTTLGTKAASFTIDNFQPESISVTSVDVPSLKLSNFKCFEHTIRPHGTGSYQVKLLIPFKHVATTSNNISSYRYFEIELYKNDDISDNNREELTFKKGDIKLYVYYYGEDPRPLLMCYENKIYRTKRLGDPERTHQVNIKYNQWSRLTDIDGCAHNVAGRNSASDANDQKILDVLIEAVQYFNPVQLNLANLPMELSNEFREGKAQKVNYLIHDLKENCKVTMKLSSSKMETYRIHTYEHNGLENQNNPAGFTLGDVIFKGTEGGHNGKLNYATVTQGTPKKMRYLVKVTGYFHTLDFDFQDPLLVILEFNDGGEGTANTKEYYKLIVRSNDVPGNMEWEKDDTVAEIINNQNKFLLFLNKLRYNLKYSGIDVNTFKVDVSDPDRETPQDFEPFIVDEINVLHKITTFIVEKKTGYSSSVTVTPTSNHPATGFSKYTHQPTPKPCQRSLVLYKGKKLLWWDNSQSKLLAIDEVQEQQLNNIDVYFSDTLDFPLLTGVFKSDNTIDYYFVKRNGDRVSWQLLDQAALKEFIGETINQNEMHTKLTENTNRRLIKLLKKIALSVVDTVLVLVDKREAYDRTAASNAYKTTLGTKAASFTIDNFQPESISVTSVDVPSLKLSNFKCFEHTIRPNGTGPYQMKLLIPLEEVSIVQYKSVYSYNYSEIELYINDDINEDNREFNFKKGESKLYVYYYSQDPRPLLMCYENKIYRTKRLGDPERTHQVNIKYNQWSRLTDIDGCAHNVAGRNSASDANDQKILDALIEVVQYFNPVQLDLAKLPKNPTRPIAEANYQTTKDLTANYLIHGFTENCKVTMKLSSSKMETYRIHTYEHNGLENQNNPAGFTLGYVIFKSINAGYNSTVNYAKTTQGPNKKMRRLVKVTGYFHTLDFDFQDPLLVILEFNDGGEGTANTKEYYKLTVRSNDVPANMEWVRDDNTVAEIINNKKQLLDYLNDVRYNLKYSAKMQLHFTRETYPFSALNHAGTTEYPNLSGTQTSVTVSKQSCAELEKKSFKCYKQEISSVKKSHLYYVTALKMSLPLRDKKDAVIQLFDETGNTPIDKLTYDYAYGDLYVYYYRQFNYPLLFCLKGSAFKPKDRDNYFSKWVKVNQIQKCDCKTLKPNETDQLANILKPVAEFMGLYNENHIERAENLLKLKVDEKALDYITNNLRIRVLDDVGYLMDTVKKDLDTEKHRTLNKIEFDTNYHRSYYHMKWDYSKDAKDNVFFASTNPGYAFYNLKHHGYDLYTFPKGVYPHRIEWYKRKEQKTDIVILVFTNTLLVYKFRIIYTSKTWKHDSFKYCLSRKDYFFVGVEPVIALDYPDAYSRYCERIKFINKLDFDSSVPTRPRKSQLALKYLHE